MNHSTTERIKSQLFPEVFYTLKSRSVKRRSLMNAALAQVNARILDLQREGELVEQELCECGHKVGKHDLKFTSEDTRLVLTYSCSVPGCNCLDPHGDAFHQHIKVMGKMNRIDQDEVAPERIRHFLSSLENYDIDGKPATPETLLSDGSDELVDEIDTAIKQRLRLSEAEKKTPAYAPISTEQEATVTSDTTVPSA